MSKRSIVLHLDERWYDALNRQLKKEDMTVEEKLDESLDAMIDQLPERVRDKISREIWEEDQRRREAAEASRSISVFRITQNGQTEHLLTEGGASMDALHTAMRLRGYLLHKGNSSERFAQAIPAADHIAPEVFQDYANERKQSTGRIVSVLDINLDRSEFSTLDALNGWEAYTIHDVCTAAWHASQKDSLGWDKRLDIFATQLEEKMIHCEGPEVGPPAGPVM